MIQRRAASLGLLGALLVGPTLAVFTYGWVAFEALAMSLFGSFGAVVLLWVVLALRAGPE